MDGMKSILKLIDQEARKITDEAEDINTKYLMGDHSLYDSKGANEEMRPKYIPIIVPRTNGVTCGWGKIEFIKPQGKWKRIHTYVPINNKQFRYNLSTFKSAPDWQLAEIEKFEKSFHVIRRKTDRLSRMAKAVKQYIRDFEEGTKEKEGEEDGM